MALQFAGEWNVFVPEATGQVIAFIRDPKDYKLNQYCQLIETKKSLGVFARLEMDNSQRFPTTDEDAWPDGALRPEGKWNQWKHDWVPFQTIRRIDSTTIGWKTIDQASFKILLAYTRGIQNQHMAKRTQRVIALAENTASWAGNTATANTLNGGAGFLDQGSDDPADPNYLSLKKMLDALTARLMLTTNGVINFQRGDSQLILIISPGLAMKIAASGEIHHYLANSQFALDQIKGRIPGQNAIYGLPDTLYGWKIVVEDAVRVAENPKASGVEASITGAPAPRRFIKSDDSAIACVRPGGLDGDYGTQTGATFQLYYYGKEIELETLDDPKNRVTTASCLADIAEVIAAPAAGFLVTDVLS